MGFLREQNTPLPPVVSFVGHSGSGKTRLLVKLIPLLRQKGYAVGTVKHHNHGVEVDRPGKDTHRHYEAGADRVALSGPGKNVYFERTGEARPPEEVIARFFTGVDIVLTEGLKKGPFPKIEVARTAVSAELTCGAEDGLIAAVADFDPGVPVPRFSADDAEGVADFLEAMVMAQADKTDWSVTLHVDGKKIPVKEFVRDVIVNVSLGMVDTLKGVPHDPASVEIVLKRQGE